MSQLTDKIKADAQARTATNDRKVVDHALYFDHRVLQAEDTIDLPLQKVEFKRPTHLVFVDLQPGANWAHPCEYLLYDAHSGDFLEKIEAQFPPFFQRPTPTLEMYKSARAFDAFARKKSMRVPLRPAEMSAHRKVTKLPFGVAAGRRYAILYSGSSNCRHVNDMEFLYRTLIDVYGFDPADIFVVNFDGTLNWTSAGSWEPTQNPTNPINYPVDNTPFRMVVTGTGNRAGFQGALATIAAKIGPRDLLFVHTNNHGGYDTINNKGFMSAHGGLYYADDFAADLATLPAYDTLLAVMEPCNSGSFIDPILAQSTAARTVAQAAVPWNQSSAGGWFFDPWAEMWISAMAGVRGDGSTLPSSPDDDLDTKISSWEAYDFSAAIDAPVWKESATGVARKVFLGKPPSLGTLKLVDDGGGTLKVIDDGVGTLKTVDDHATLKLADDHGTLKLIDDGGGSLKLIDDGVGTLKTIDDGHGTLKAVDDAIIRPPLTPVPERRAAPFILSTPHHSAAWGASFPEAFASKLAEYEATIGQYEATLTQLAQARDAGQGGGELDRQIAVLSREHQALKAEYEQLKLGR